MSKLAAAHTWQGSLELGDDWAVWQGAVGDTSAHRHFAAQAVLVDGASGVIDETGRRHGGPLILIEPLARHRLLPAPSATLVFIEPRRHPAAQLPAAIASALRGASASADHLDGSASPGFWSEWMADQAAAASPADAWEDTVRAAIDAQLANGRLGLADAARPVHLSPDRFRHLFAERIGMPFRRFVLWRRLRLAVAALQAGADATQAAHDAGFADAAHFARTLRATFGVTARQSLRRARPAQD